LSTSDRSSVAAVSILDKAFDRSGAVRRPSYRRLVREVCSAVSYFPIPPDPASLPPGRGHVVLVIPAFLMSDAITQPLREFLQRCGYRTFGWNAGVNVGPTPQALTALRRRTTELRHVQGGPVSVVGVSLGGLLARDLAYDAAKDIRQVITIASPVNLPTASTIEPLFRLCASLFSPAIDIDRLSLPTPVPFTSIYTRDDGVVAWESCETEDSVEVGGPHIMICRNPKALRALAERLAPTAVKSPRAKGR